MLSIVVAQDKNRAIGKDNKVPWRLRSDLIHLKNLIIGQVVILGRKTFDSLVSYYDKSGRPLPAKLYIIITRQTDYKPTRENTLIASSFKKALEQANKFSDDIFVIGGAQIYNQALPYADKLYVTEVDTKADGDTFFPALNHREWVETSREKHYKDADNDHNYDFVVLDRHPQ